MSHRGMVVRRPGNLLLALVVGLALQGQFVPGFQGDARAMGPVGVAATPQPPPDAEPLVVDDDPITTLVPANSGAATIFAVGQQGLYRSDDGGDSWRRAGALPPPGTIAAAVDSPLVLLAGAHGSCSRAIDDLTPLSRSGDGGATWEVVEGVSDVRPLAIWTQFNLALAESCQGLRLSTDGGRTWQTDPLPVLGGDYEVAAFTVLAGSGVTQPMGLVAGTSEGGTGQVWRLDLSNPENPTADALVLPGPLYWGNGALAGRDQLYVIGTPTGVLVSLDSGQSWRSSRSGLEDVTVSVDPFQEIIPETERSRGLTAVAIDPGDVAHLLVGSVDGIYESTDTGVTWTRVSGVDGPVTALYLESDRLLVETSVDADGVETSQVWRLTLFSNVAR